MEEIFDVYDIDGNLLGQRPKSFCHGPNPGVFHKPVWIWIYNDKKQILVQKRAKCKKNNPSKWDMPSAGHVDAGETSLEGCVRETKEELGLDVNQNQFEFIVEWKALESWELAQVYLLNCNVKAKDMKLQVEEVECVKWLDYKEFEKLLYSDEFVPHQKSYKDFVCDIFKKKFEIK